MDLAVGVALWSLPPPIKLPGILGLAALKAVKSRRKRSRDDANKVDASRGVRLAWVNLNMSLAAKKAKSKDKSGEPAAPTAGVRLHRIPQKVYNRIRQNYTDVSKP